MRRISWILVAGFAVALGGQEGYADILFLKDGNIIECKFVKKEKRNKPQGGTGQFLVVKDRQGKTTAYDEKEVAQLAICKPSWEREEENKKWYEAEKAKIKDTADDHKKLARACLSKDRKDDLEEQADEHYHRAFELEWPNAESKEKTPDDNVKVLEAYAKRVRDEYSLYEEYLIVQKRVLELKRAVAEKNGKLTPDTLVGLGRQAKDVELFDDARRFFEEALRLNDKHSSAKSELALMNKMLEVPLNLEMYRALKGSFARGIAYLKPKQNQDGTFGGDYYEAGVHARRGMTALGAMALWAEWQLAKFEAKDPEKTREIPPGLEKALLVIMESRKGEGNPGEYRLEGDDMWGAIFSTEALSFLAKEEAIMQKHGDAMKKAIKEAIERLKALQRRDGGWYYYNFVQTSSSFSTASAIIALKSLWQLGFEKETVEGMIPQAATCIEGLRQGEGTYKYMEMGNQYHPASSPLGACARSPIAEYALFCAGKGDDKRYTNAVNFWWGNRHILQKIKGREGTHIGKGMTAPYYFLYSHMYMARLSRYLPNKGHRRGLARGIGGLMLSYQEPDGKWSDWLLPVEKPEEKQKFFVSQTAMGLITLWHLMSGDKDMAVEPPMKKAAEGGNVETPGGKKEEKPTTEPPKPPAEKPPGEKPPEPPKSPDGK